VLPLLLAGVAALERQTAGGGGEEPGVVAAPPDALGSSRVWSSAPPVGVA
jgi:hypothetical protein